MKKILIVLIVLVAFTSCSKDEDIIFTDKDIIGIWQLVVMKDNDTVQINRFNFKENYTVDFYADRKDSDRKTIYKGNWNMPIDSLNATFNTELIINKETNDTTIISSSISYIQSTYRIIDYNRIYWYAYPIYRTTDTILTPSKLN